MPNLRTSIRRLLLNIPTGWSWVEAIRGLGGWLRTLVPGGLYPALHPDLARSSSMRVWLVGFLIAVAAELLVRRKRLPPEAVLHTRKAFAPRPIIRSRVGRWGLRIGSWVVALAVMLSLAVAELGTQRDQSQLFSVALLSVSGVTEDQEYRLRRELLNLSHEDGYFTVLPTSNLEYREMKVGTDNALDNTADINIRIFSSTAPENVEKTATIYISTKSDINDRSAAFLYMSIPTFADNASSGAEYQFAGSLPDVAYCSVLYFSGVQHLHRENFKAALSSLSRFRTSRCLKSNLSILHRASLVHLVTAHIGLKQNDSALALAKEEFALKTPQTCYEARALAIAVGRQGWTISFPRDKGEVATRSEFDSLAERAAVLCEAEAYNDQNKLRGAVNLAWTSLLNFGRTRRLDLAEKAFMLAPRSSLVLNNLSVAQMENGEYRECEDLSERAVELSGYLQEPAARMNLAMCQMSNGKPMASLLNVARASIMTTEPASEKLPNRPAILYAAATRSRVRHLPIVRPLLLKVAIADLRGQLESNQNDDFIRYNLAKALLEYGQAVEALTESRILLDSHRNWHSVNVLMGDCSRALGRRDEAMRWYHSAQRLLAATDFSKIDKNLVPGTVYSVLMDIKSEDIEDRLRSWD